MRTNWQLAFGRSGCWPAGACLVIYTRLLNHPVFHSICFVHSGGRLYSSGRQTPTPMSCRRRHSNIETSACQGCCYTSDICLVLVMHQEEHVHPMIKMLHYRCYFLVMLWYSVGITASFGIEFTGATMS